MIPTGTLQHANREPNIPAGKHTNGDIPPLMA